MSPLEPDLYRVFEGDLFLSYLDLGAAVEAGYGGGCDVIGADDD